MSSTTGSDQLLAGPPCRLLWPDSEVRELVWRGADLCLHLSAACVCRTDPATGAPEQGFLRGVTLILRGARTSSRLSDALGRLHAVRWQGAACPVWLPCRHTEPLGLELQFANGTQLLLTAQALEAQVMAGARFFPSLAC